MSASAEQESGCDGAQEKKARVATVAMGMPDMQAEGASPLVTPDILQVLSL